MEIPSRYTSVKEFIADLHPELIADFEKTSEDWQKYIEWFLGKCTTIKTDPLRCGGKPTIGDHRFTAIQLVAEICEGDLSLKQLADDFGQDLEEFRSVLWDLALPLIKHKPQSAIK